MVLTGLPMFGETNSIKIILDEIDEKKLKAQDNTNSGTKTSNKST